MNKLEQELKPCPFCGNEVHWCDCGDPSGEGCHQITCDRCGIFDLAGLSNGNFSKVETMKELRDCMTAKWNIRAE